MLDAATVSRVVTACSLLSRSYRRARGESFSDSFHGWVSAVEDWDYLQLEVAANVSNPLRLAAVVPGTNELRDWFRGNLRWFPQRVLDTPGRWRSGAREGAEYVWSRLRPEMDARGVIEADIYGHSLGGMIAQPVIAYAKASRAPGGQRYRLRGITLGSPASGTRKAADFVSDSVLRVTMGFDAIPFLDAPWWSDRGQARLELRKKSAIDAIREHGVQMLTDHSIDEYLEAALALQSE